MNNITTHTQNITSADLQQLVAEFTRAYDLCCTHGASRYDWMFKAASDSLRKFITEDAYYNIMVSFDY